MGGPLERSAVEERLHQLCNLLRAMHTAGQQEEVDQAGAGIPRQTVHFAQLQCVGWTLASEESLARIGLVFYYPSTQQAGVQPQSLRDRIGQSRGHLQSPVPPLGQRFSLAYSLCTAVANIVSVGWSKTQKDPFYARYICSSGEFG
jgi:hypothetical protein